MFVSQHLARSKGGGGVLRGPNPPVRVMVRVGIGDFTAVAVVSSAVVVALVQV